MLLFYFLFFSSFSLPLSPFLLIYLHMSTVLAFFSANVTPQRLIATKKRKDTVSTPHLCTGTGPL